VARSTPLKRKCEFKWFKIISSIFKFWPIRKVLSVFGKIEIKFGFEDLEEMNNFLHRNFPRFEMDFALKFREVSRLEFDRIHYSFFLKL
jgi:hypothetical protein